MFLKNPTGNQKIISDPIGIGYITRYSENELFIFLKNKHLKQILSIN